MRITAVMPKGHLLVNVGDASLDASALAPGVAQVVVVLTVPGGARAQSRGVPVAVRDDSAAARWDQQLALELRPDSRALEVHLYGRGEQEEAADWLLASGSFALDTVFDQDEEAASVPLVSLLGKHAGDIRVQAYFHHCRSPGKQRDVLGREVVVGAAKDGRRPSLEAHWPVQTAYGKPGSPTGVY